MPGAPLLRCFYPRWPTRPERDDRASLTKTRTLARACFHLRPAYLDSPARVLRTRRNQPLPARRCEPNQSLRLIRFDRPQRALLSLTLTQASSHAVSRSGGAPKLPNTRAARANHGLRTSHLSKPTPQNGQKATRRPKRYWLAICIPSLDLQLGHLVRSRYSNAPAMLATPRTPTAASR